MRKAVCVGLLFAAACATTNTVPPPSLAQRIDAIASAPPFDRAIWGIAVADDSGKLLYARNAGTLLIPASNRKLFAAATVASCEGLDHRLTTELWRDGDDVVIRGGGDPSFGGRWAFDRDAVFAPFVAALRARGITHVRDVVADVSRFDRDTIPGSWKWGNLGTDYSVPVDALAYNENVVGIVADHCASPVVTTDPAFIRASASVVCGSGETAVRVDATNVVTLTGAMGEHFQTLAGIADPALYGTQALRDALLHAGIAITGAARVSSAPRTSGERLAVIESPPLFELLSVMLKPSQNHYAETLYKGLSDPGTYGGAQDVELRFLTGEVGIDPNDFRFLDGSGLSPDDLVAPRAVVTLLRWMNDPARRGAWWMMLARPGEEGTLRRRLLPLASRMRGKTGSISGVNALSGIIEGPAGTHRYFSIILNHHTAGTAQALHAIDAIAVEIAGDGSSEFLGVPRSSSE